MKLYPYVEDINGKEFQFTKIVGIFYNRTIMQTTYIVILVNGIVIEISEKTYKIIRKHLIK